jgi:hypothetical protein
MALYAVLKPAAEKAAPRWQAPRDAAEVARLEVAREPGLALKQDWNY